jgi:copper chaperone CopZ
MTQTKTTLKTQGIKCEGCATAARSAVEKLPGVTQVQFDLPGKTATVTHDTVVDRTEVARALTQAGFPAE